MLLFHELGRGPAVLFLYVNVLDLLPIGFLDGGRVVSGRRSPRPG